MNPTHFENQVGRLREVYGERSIPKERIRLLWDDVSDLSDYWMTSAVSFLIKNCRYAPMFDDWDKLIHQERDTAYQRQKQEHTRHAEEFMKSVYSDEDRKGLFHELGKIARGALTKNEVDSFISMTENAAGIRYRCNKCKDEGLYHDEIVGGSMICSCNIRYRNRR